MHTGILLIVIIAVFTLNAEELTEAKIKQVFDTFANGEVQGLTRESVERMATKAGLKKEEGTKAFQDADKDNNSFLSFEEFLVLVTEGFGNDHKLVQGEK